jgi:glycosyltransferase involved in cell wall biosynthesis
LTILIPFWNESKTIEKLISEIQSAHGNQDFFYIFINDGSTDNSVEILKHCLSGSSIKHEIISLDSNVGKSGAIRKAISRINSSHFAILDADLELNPRDICRMWEIIKNEKAQAVFGYRRFLSQSSFTYRYTIGNLFISNWFGIFYNVVHTDIMCGLKILPTQAVQGASMSLKGFAIEIELPMLLWKKGIRVYEVEVDYVPRGWEQGKVIGIKDAVYILTAIAVRRLFFDRKELT